MFDDALMFVAIVELGSLTRAAQHLGVNASAVSKRLAKLEKALGIGRAAGAANHSAFASHGSRATFLCANCRGG